MSRDCGPGAADLSHLDVDLDRDAFTKTLIGGVAEVLEELVGTDRAAGFISLVGAKMGAEIRAGYRQKLGEHPFDDATLAGVLVDLKARIRGGFSVESMDADKIVLVNDACPFESSVHGRESLCMMTSNVFGKIASDERGYSKVTLEETIARGNGRCRVVVWLKPTQEAEDAEGREYFNLEH